jgi:signal transduction histidine kinase
LSFSWIRRRFLWRLRATTSPDEIRRIERWLATARVFLAISALAAIWMDPQQSETILSPWAYWLLAFYIVNGVVILILLRLRQQSTSAFRLLIHCLDIVWPALITFFAVGPRSPFFLFFVFVLTAAAYRWGLWETVSTALAAVALLWLESLALHVDAVAWLDNLLLRHHLPSLGANFIELSPNHLFIRSVYLLVTGLLLGSLAEQQKQLRAEKTVITRILGHARVESGLSGTLRDILRELLLLYDARAAVIASHDSNSYRVFLAELQKADGNTPLNWKDPSAKDRETYLFDSPADVAFLSPSAATGRAGVLGLDALGNRLDSLDPGALHKVGSNHGCHSMLAVSFTFGQDWSGRIFLFDPLLASDQQEELRFLKEIIRQVGPAVYNVYLLRRLRLRASAVERARFARELHDGAVQSLIAVEMQVDVLRRQSLGRADFLTAELVRIQSLLREEVLKLRELMQQMKSLDVDARKLMPFIEDTVERFQRETGISARFVSDLAEVDMPQKICREVAHIVQEGLVNVRKHSQARQVLVRLAVMGGDWRVTIEDDGRGFPFSGRLSHAELEALRKGPLVIKERVRLLEGELTIESTPGQGSRLEISIPRKREVAYG